MINRVEVVKSLYNIDIIYVNYNSEHDLISSIKSLKNIVSQWPGSISIFIADNSFCEVEDSTARSLYREIQRLRFSGWYISYLPSDSNLGFGKACNKAARLGKGEFLIFANCDTSFEGIDAHILLDTIIVADSEDVAIVGPRVLSETGHLHASCFSYDPISILLKPFRHVRKIGRITKAIPKYKTFKKRIDRITYEGMPKSRVSNVDWVSGCLMICDRAFFELSGGFDEQYFLYFEDVDLCRKARRLGYSVVFDPRMTIVHRGKYQSSSQIGVLSSILFNKAARWHLISWLKYMWKWRKDFLHKLRLALTSVKAAKPKSTTNYKLNFSVFHDAIDHD
jgi:N-acetylglucosaminyl-diphospho-decaprenol L-rhamnosyltransferase